jgi:hypothetical protein
MKKIAPITLVLLLLAATSQLWAQVDTYYYSDSKIIFCEEVESNEPVNESTSFIIPSSGGSLTVQVNNGSKPLKTTQMIVDIYKIPAGGNDYTEFVETKNYDIKETWNKPYFEYTFSGVGEYKFYVYNADEVFINSGTVTMKLKGSTTTTTNTRSNPRSGGDAPVDTYYYSNSKVIFCEDVVNNEPSNASTEFTIPKAGAYLTVQVDNGKALKTTQLVVDIYKKPKGSSDYTEFVETKRYDIEEHWNRPYFTYTFYSGGEYKLSVYNADEVWINAGYVTIKQK